MSAVLKSKLNFENNVLNYENLSFYLFENESSLKIDHLIDYNAIILDAIDLEFTRTILFEAYLFDQL
jgi:hypothetical protein